MSSCEGGDTVSLTDFGLDVGGFESMDNEGESSGLEGSSADSGYTPWPGVVLLRP